MEVKCNLCELFGNKPHCHNCKVLNKTKTGPQEIACSLEEFVEYIENNDDITEHYGIGDYKTITLYTGEEVTMNILDFGKDQLASGGEAKVTLGIFDWDCEYNMNPTDTNSGGWRDSMMRKRMERIFRLLPPVLQAHIKPVIKHTYMGAPSNCIGTTTDKLFLFSESEILGIAFSSRHGEGAQYAYFSMPNHKGFKHWPWLHLRSPVFNNDKCFCAVFGESQTNHDMASSGGGVIFGFCI